MIIALTAVALLGLMASATMTIAGIMANEAQRKSQTKLVGGFIQNLEAIATNPYACMGNGNGPNNMTGLEFNPGNTNSGNLNQKCANTNECLQKGVGAGNKLGVALGTNLGKDARKGEIFTTLGIKVDDIYLTEIAAVPNATSTYSGKLMVAVSTTADPKMSFAPREIGLMNLTFDAQTKLTACNSAPSARSLCEAMDCAYNANVPAGVQRCSCGFPEMTCQPGEYISGVRADGSPMCTHVELNCQTTHGPGFFFAGVDGQGQPVCLAVEGTFGTPTPAPSGACWNLVSKVIDLSTINSAGYPSANWSACPAYTQKAPPKTPVGSCTLGDTCTVEWKYGTDDWVCGTGTCSAAVSCPIGTSGAGAGGPAAPMGCSCNTAGESWNGSACQTGAPASGFACRDVGSQEAGFSGGSMTWMNTYPTASACNSSYVNIGNRSYSCGPCDLAGVPVWQKVRYDDIIPF